MAEAAYTKEQVIDVIKTVYDPEIPVNIFDLGLIYDVDVEDNEVNVVMTLTAPLALIESTVGDVEQWAASLRAQFDPPE